MAQPTLNPVEALVIEALTRLQKVNPEHELVTIFTKKTIRNGKFTDRFWDKDYSRKGRPSDFVAKVAQTNYYNQVKEVLKKEHDIEI